MTSPSSLYILNYKTENPLTTLGFSGPVPDGPISHIGYLSLRLDDPNGENLPSWKELNRIAALYREAFESTGPNDPCAVSRSVLSYRDARSFLDHKKSVMNPPLDEHVTEVIRLGGHLHTSGKYTEAIACYDVVLQHDPRSRYALARLGRGQALRKLGRQEEAEATLKSLAMDVTANTSIRSMAFASLSDMALEQKRWDQAFQYACIAIEIDGKNFYGYVNAGHAATQLNRLAEARVFYHGALDLDPKYHGKAEEVEKVKAALGAE